MKILHLITTIERGGAEKALLTLVKQQIHMGMAPQVMMLKGNPEMVTDFVQVGCLVNDELSKLNIFQQINYLRRISHEFSLIHCHLPRAEILGALARKKTSLIVSKHNSEDMIPKCPGRLSRLLAKFVLSRSSVVICISNAVKDYLISVRELPSQSTKVKVIHYGIEENLKNTKKSHSKDKTFRIGNIARLEPQKNLFLFVDIINALRQTLPNVCGEILGTGSLQRTLQLTIDETGAANYIKLRPKVEDVDSFLMSLDLFLFTSNYEGFGLVLLEAMRCDLPIVASNISAIPEVLGSSHIGLVEPNNLQHFTQTIARLIESQEIRNGVVNYQRKQLLKFSAERYERGVFGCYLLAL